MKALISCSIGTLIALASSLSAEELSRDDQIMLATKEIFVAVVEFVEGGAVNHTKEKRLEIVYDGKKAVYGLESIKVTDPIFTSMGIEFRDTKFSSRDNALAITEAWNREAELRVNVRLLPISHNPAVVIFTYDTNFPRSPLIMSKLFGIDSRKAIEEILMVRVNSELKMRAKANGLVEVPDEGK